MWYTGGRGRRKTDRNGPENRSFMSRMASGAAVDRIEGERQRRTTVCDTDYSGERCQFIMLPVHTAEGYSRTTALAVIAVVLSSVCLVIIGLLLMLSHQNVMLQLYVLHYSHRLTAVVFKEMCSLIDEVVTETWTLLHDTEKLRWMSVLRAFCATPFTQRQTARKEGGVERVTGMNIKIEGSLRLVELADTTAYDKGGAVGCQGKAAGSRSKLHAILLHCVFFAVQPCL
ncbi:hypothetical protein XENOCAPTIV_021152 [Xenoophorus captivus]|uniref:Uncharacterized protein n=1 Tax=Xenoophorus captivus TaxID=1517983 RepID=A0ABV0QDX8_9TELE